MTKTRKRLTVYLVLIGMLFLLALSLFGCTYDASVYRPERDYGYEISNYNVDIVVDEDKNLHITEEITADFFDYTNGIYRYIPLKQSIGVPNGNGGRDVKYYENTISNFELLNDNTYLYDNFISEGYEFYAIAMDAPRGNGESFTFKFSYDLFPGDDRDTSKDFFYQNIIGTGWDTIIRQLNFTITFPKETDFSGASFYVGLFGDDTTGTQVEYSTTLNEDGSHTISGTYGNGDDVYLDYGEALTIYLPLEQGYFNVTRSYLFDYILIALFVIGLALIIWLIIKHRRKEPIIDVVEFSAPDNLTPTEAGYIIDKSLKGKDISALIVYWADKGIIKIEEKDKKIYLAKLKDLPENAKEHEKIFFNAVFTTDKPIACDEIKFLNNFVGEKIRKSVAKEKGNYFYNKSDKYFSWCAIFLLVITIVDCVRIALASYDTFSLFIKVIVAFIMFAAFMWLTKIQKDEHKMSKGKLWLYRILPLILILGTQACFIFWAEGYNDPFYTRCFYPILSLLLFFIYPFLEQYTKLGRECLGKLRGLRQYIQVAEKDRMEAMANENPEIFYKVLPYAYVLGVSDVYLKKFADVPLQNPNWVTFSDGMTLWLVMMLLNRNILALSVTLNYTLTRQIISSVARVASSVAVSRIGGGGGFSGGGSGGGGGGRF